MFSVKRVFVLVITFVFTLSFVYAQNREMTVEEQYMMESIEIMIIRETARSDSREQKAMALERIEEAIERGNTSPEIRETLEFLSREGRRIVARESGRVTNNFPEVRMRSARLLGRMGTEEATKALIEIIQIENEPMVIQEAVKSLGDLGFNEDNEAINAIVWVVSRFDRGLNPDNLIALASIESIEKIARANNGLNSRDAIALLVSISENTRYIPAVRERARMALADLRSYGGG